MSAAPQHHRNDLACVGGLALVEFFFDEGDDCARQRFPAVLLV
jgi:hypothetical protein